MEFSFFEPMLHHVSTQMQRKDCHSPVVNPDTVIIKFGHRSSTCSPHRQIHRNSILHSLQCLDLVGLGVCTAVRTETNSSRTRQVEAERVPKKTHFMQFHQIEICIPLIRSQLAITGHHKCPYLLQ